MGLTPRHVIVLLARRLDQSLNRARQFRVIFLRLVTSPRREVVTTANAGAEFVQPGVDRRTTPAKHGRSPPRLPAQDLNAISA